MRNAVHCVYSRINLAIKTISNFVCTTSPIPHSEGLKGIKELYSKVMHILLAYNALFCTLAHFSSGLHTRSFWKDLEQISIKHYGHQDDPNGHYISLVRCD